MLLALIVCQLSVLVAANPFHKYPFVFLLDVGNEELEKTNTEQIRLSIPGGSVALRYPAIGDGNTIGHLRVSSIDFGTALKANIVDGGPGYKYAVLVLMGNPGVPYDAVVTVQTVNDPFSVPSIEYVTNSGGDTVQVEEDANNSAEDMSDASQLNNYQSENNVQSSNAELMQSSVNVYNYAKNEVMDQSDEFDENSNSDNNNDELSDKFDANSNFYNKNNGPSDEFDNNEESESGVYVADSESNQRDIHEEYTDDIDQTDDSNVQVKGIDTDDEDDDKEVSPELAQSVPNEYAEDNEATSVIRSRIDSNYDGLRPYLSGGEVYYEDADQKNTRPDYQQQPLDYEAPDEIHQIFNDGEVHNDGDKYRDSNNNNYIDSDDSYAVAY